MMFMSNRVPSRFLTALLLPMFCLSQTTTRDLVLKTFQKSRPDPQPDSKPDSKGCRGKTLATAKTREFRRYPAASCQFSSKGAAEPGDGRTDALAHASCHQERPRVI